jgi:hypothetical protein
MEVEGLAMNDTRYTGDSGEDRMSDLKTQVQCHEYKVDSHRVAEEMIRRMRFARWARQALLSDGVGGPEAAPAQ